MENDFLQNHEKQFVSRARISPIDTACRAIACAVFSAAIAYYASHNDYKRALVAAAADALYISEAYCSAKKSKHI